jgi:hypothetical protein
MRAHLLQLLSKVKAAPWPEENPGTYLPSVAMTLIIATPGVLGGRPRVDGTRISVLSEH